MKNLVKKNIKDLKKELDVLRENLRKDKFSPAGSTSNDSFKTRKTRKDIARILTVINNK